MPRSHGYSKPRRTVQGPGGSASHRTGSKAVSARVVQQAAKDGKKVSVRGTFDTAAGWRSVTLDGSTTAQRDFLADAGGTESMRPMGARPGRLDTPTSRQADAAGAVEIRVGSSGVDAADLWAAWLDWSAENDGDWWDFLDAWADADYFGELA